MQKITTVMAIIISDMYINFSIILVLVVMNSPGTFARNFMAGCLGVFVCFFPGISMVLPFFFTNVAPEYCMDYPLFNIAHN